MATRKTDGQVRIYEINDDDGELNGDLIFAYFDKSRTPKYILRDSDYKHIANLLYRVAVHGAAQIMDYWDDNEIENYTQDDIDSLTLNEDTESLRQIATYSDEVGCYYSEVDLGMLVKDYCGYINLNFAREFIRNVVNDDDFLTW